MASAFGKLILFGEHFTVYGLPGIATKIPLDVTVQITPHETTVFDVKPFDAVIMKENEPKHILCQVYDALFPEGTPPAQITITGDCIPQAGLGYSAACCRALVEEMNNFLDAKWSVEEKEKRILAGERVTHGTPSGIDNACALYDNIILFQKEKEIQELSHHLKLHLVIVDTGLRHNTKQAVDYVQQLAQTNSSAFAYILNAAKRVIEQGMQAIQDNDIETIGDLMNENHDLLKAIGVSCAEIEQAIKHLHELDILGAKLTGAGMGGCVIGLCENKEHQEKVAQSMQEQGYALVALQL